MPNTHRRRRRDETVESRRVGGVYWALVIDTCCDFSKSKVLVVWLSGNVLVAINKLVYASPVNTWMGRYTVSVCPATDGNSAFHPFRVDKSSTSLSDWG